MTSTVSGYSNRKLSSCSSRSSSSVSARTDTAPDPGCPVPSSMIGAFYAVTLGGVPFFHRMRSTMENIFFYSSAGDLLWEDDRIA